MTGYVDRYFFAALPDPVTAERIGKLAARLCTRYGLTGKLQAPERLHVTLCPVPFGLPDSVMAELREAAEGAEMQPFTVMFDHVMSFGGQAGNRPLVLCEGEGTIGLRFLHEAVGRVMAKAGLHHLFVPKTFHPHVTLLYGDHALPRQAVEPISWRVEKLTLIHSLQGRSIHRRVAEWPLRGPLPIMSRPPGSKTQPPAANHLADSKTRNDG
jgi:RNA 2',3'-cyclic 3'-phosphodiesterase